jgi:hypothetical protein
VALSPDKKLELELDATCTRNQFTRDPAPVIAELVAIAGERTDLLAKVAGMWAGFSDGEHTHDLAVALLDIPGADE